MPNYVERQDLANEIRHTAATGEISPRLVEIIQKICTGIIGRYRYSQIEEAEAIAEALLNCCKAVYRGNIKPEKNGFSYLTTIALNAQRKLAVEHRKYHEKMSRYADFLDQNERLPGRGKESW